MLEQTSLFDIAPTEQPRKRRPIEIRREKERRAFEAADNAFKERFERYILEYASVSNTFIAENVRDSWLKEGKPAPREWRCTGTIFRKLVAENKLKIVGSDMSKSRGALMTQYIRV